MASASEAWGSTSSTAVNSSDQKFEDNFSPARAIPDTEHYVAALESRLARLKGRNRDVSAREMLAVLGEARHDHTGRLIASDPVPSAREVTASYLLSDDSDAPVHATYLERRLFPERQALTQEELRHLLEADFLEKQALAAAATAREARDRASISSADSEPNR
uniref:Protein, containing CCDC32 domain n=1 Tax=Rhipicephalus zambeziensis TaxID=60191 RepID=A0A224YJ92_9ACAR